MKKVWIVYCPHCDKSVTGAIPPKNTGFVETVKCVLCNRPINAKNGHFVLHPVILKKEEPDLLGVE